jgi:hypothetical protein
MNSFQSGAIIHNLGSVGYGAFMKIKSTAVNCQSQSGTPIYLFAGRMRFLKRLENSFLLVQRDPDACVANKDLRWS